MSGERDDEMQALVNEFASTPEEQRDLLEAHRLLEHDLSRLADAAPPVDFVQSVMRKVAAQPVRPVSKADVMWAVGILVAVLSAAAALFALSGASIGQTLASALVMAKQVTGGLSTVLQMAWRTAAGPLVMGLSGAVAVSLVGIRQLAAMPEKAAL